MTLRFVNASILVLVLLLTLSGLYGIIWTMPLWMYDAHRIFAWALIVLIPWKTVISWGSLRRGFKTTFDRGIMPIVALALSGATIFVIVLGLMWAWRLGPRVLWLNQTVISWHWILALIIMVPFVLHAWARWPRPKRDDLLSRRSFLKIAGLSALSIAGWQLGGAIASSRQAPDAPRRASGSRLSGMFTGNDFPVTTGAGDGRERVDLDGWRFKVSGEVQQILRFSYEELLALPQSSQVATLDCTVGWYSVQRWRGVSLPSLLEQAGAGDDLWGIRLRAASGHQEQIPLAEANASLLATHVGGERLSHVHGFPLRAVVPSRRGWFWVKWLAEVIAIRRPTAV